ncbi:MAG TPA: hypothetical protein VGO89_08315, partial [Streptomyces sp.]|nr:hypothetical protein [Streptomyces sp.]
MASGPSDPPRRPPGGDDQQPEGANAPDPSTTDAPDPHVPREPRIRHSPPGPTDDRARGLPLASPWGMPPFSSPTPEDEAPEPPKGRRPYSSPTADPETEERHPRRLTNRPDKLVATGPPRPDPSPAVQPGPESRPEPE